MYIKSADDPKAGNDKQQTQYYLGKKKIKFGKLQQLCT